MMTQNDCESFFLMLINFESHLKEITKHNNKKNTKKLFDVSL